MRLTGKQILQTFLFFSIGVFLIYYQINQLSSEEKFNALAAVKNANYAWIFIAFSCAILSHVIRGFRWAMMINTTNETVRPKNAFYALMIGYLTNGFIPRFGEIVRCGVLSKKENVNFEKLVGTVVAERLFDFVMLFAVIGLTLLLQYDFLASLIQERILNPLHTSLKESSKSLITLGLLAVLALIVLYIIGRWVIKRLSLTEKVLVRWKSFRKTFLEGLKTILNLKEKWWLFILQSVVMWVLYFFMTFVVFQSLNGAKHLGPEAGLSALTMGSIAFLVPTPGGLGSYHEFVSRTLQLYDISEVIGVSLSWLSWLSSYIAILVTGLLSLVLIGTNNK